MDVDLVVESALSVASQDTLPENAQVKEVEVVGMAAEMIGMAAEVVVVDQVAIMDLIEMEIVLEAAAAGMVVDMGENDITVIVLVHTIVVNALS